MTGQPVGRRTVSRVRWSAIGAAVAITLGGGGLLTTSASVDSGNRSIFVPITPCRLMDTRPAPDNIGPRSTPIGSGESYIAQVTGSNGNCTIPATATAVSMNVTIITPTSASFLTIWPADQSRPLTANQNWIANQPPTPNAVTVALSSTGIAGQIGIYNLAGTVHIAADIVGYYDTHTHDDRYFTKPQVDQKIAAIPPGAVGPTGPVGPSPAGPTGPGVNGFATRATLDDLGVGTRHWTSIALGADGLPIVAFFDLTGGRLLVNHCTERACTSSSTNVVDGSSDDAGSLPSLAIGVDGLPIIVYGRNSTSEVIVSHCADLTCTAPATRTVLGTGTTGWMTVGADGLPIIALVDLEVSGGLQVVHCANVACTASSSTTVIAGGFIFYSAIAIGADGFPIIASTQLISGSDARLLVVHCTSTSCSTHDAAVVLGPNAGVGVDMAIGADGRAIIAAKDDPQADDLVVHHCDDTACSTAATHPVDEAGDVGTSPAIAVGPDGLPIIAYYDDAPNNDLKVAKCVDVACTAPATISVVDALGGVGFYASMALAADGLAMISYLELISGTDTNVKVAKCGDLTCRPILPG